MALKNCMVAQSGGPTAAINASLSGVIRGVYASSVYDTVYGSLNGITGILNNELINLTDLINEHPENLTRLITTPAMYLGSCRYKLPDYMDDDSPYVFIFNQFETYHIEAFFYIGGNDSMDTVAKLSSYGEKIGSSVRIIGIQRRSTTIFARQIIRRALALPPNILRRPCLRSRTIPLSMP